MNAKLAAIAMQDQVHSHVRELVPEMLGLITMLGDGGRVLSDKEADLTRAVLHLVLGDIGCRMAEAAEKS